MLIVQKVLFELFINSYNFFFKFYTTILANLAKLIKSKQYHAAHENIIQIWWKKIKLKQLTIKSIMIFCINIKNMLPM